MNKILSEKTIITVSEELKTKKKKIVLVGGCFDILHLGHIYFLNEARKLGDVLFILLESDENIRKLKGNGRPLNSQNKRSIVLSLLKPVSFIFPLKGVTNDQIYDKLIVQIKPDAIAITEGDPGIEKRKSQSEIIGAKLKIIKKLKGESTTDLITKNG